MSERSKPPSAPGKLTEAELDQKLIGILAPCFSDQGDLLERALIIAKRAFSRCKDLEKIRSGTQTKASNIAIPDSKKS